MLLFLPVVDNDYVMLLHTKKCSRKHQTNIVAINKQTNMLAAGHKSEGCHM